MVGFRSISETILRVNGAPGGEGTLGGDAQTGASFVSEGMARSATVPASTLPGALVRAAERSAAPEAVSVTLARLAEARPGVVDRLVADDELTGLGSAVVAVVAASRSLARTLLVDPDAMGVLGDLRSPVSLDTGETASADALARRKQLELLRIAALDLTGALRLEEVGTALAHLAEAVLARAVALGAVDRRSGLADGFAVIGMGKLGGTELNYASDVDVLFVTSDDPDEETARRVLAVARKCFRVDANLRPDGRSGALTRPLESYAGYWSERAGVWELQALIKARPVAGDRSLGERFAQAAAEAVWARTYSSEELAEVRKMKARSESVVERRGLLGREIKRGPGGIRDVEFAVQLLQLVHGRNDPQIRDRSTLGALEQLSGAGYIDGGDETALASAYRFLRTVEHRLQLVEEEQTHSVPSNEAAHQHLARVLGFRDEPSSTASYAFDEALRTCQRDVRAVHERLFFRPLLEAFAALDGGAAVGMGADAVSERLAAFGFADADRTSSAVRELAGGLTRSSKLMEQLLPLLLDWLSLTPDPDLGLLGLRNLVVHAHHRTLLVPTFRESPEAARRLCVLLGTSKVLAESMAHNPELIPSLADDASLATSPRHELVAEALARLGQRGEEPQRRDQLIRMRQEQFVKIAARDLLDFDDVRATGSALSSVSEALLEAALAGIEREVPFSVIGLGRFGGAELSYASDLDVLFVFDGDTGDTRGAGGPGGGDVRRGEAVAEALSRFLRGPSPSQRILTLDLGLRPEGGQGRIARDLAGYAKYFARWAQTWERQAMSRARCVAGDRDLADRFLAATESFVWDRELTDSEVAEIRRMKARIERERIPSQDDPQFHLKLGRGSLSDIEWTVQLLQLRHRVPGTGTMEALDSLLDAEAISSEDADILRAAYRFCERTRNRWFLVGALPGGGSPGDSLPTQAHQMSRLARSLDTTPASLRDEYRRFTRRSRQVVERLFYGIERHE